MAESTLHRAMKSIMRHRLRDEGYVVMDEPLFPPSPRMSWSSYRPDILGYRRKEGVEEVALVECETHPNTRRMIAKNWSSVSFQRFLFREGSIRKLLAVPQGRLGGINMVLRRDWEIWVLGRSEAMTMIPKLEQT